MNNRCNGPDLVLNATGQIYLRRGSGGLKKWDRIRNWFNTLRQR